MNYLLRMAKIVIKRFKKPFSKKLIKKKPILSGDNHYHMSFKDIRKIKNDGEILTFLESFKAEHEKNEKAYTDRLKYVAKLFKGDDCDMKKKVYDNVIEGLKAGGLTSGIIRDSGRLGITLKPVASFRTCLNIRSRKNELGEYCLEWKLNPKLNSISFINALNVKTPWVVDGYFKCQAIPEKTEIAIKPAAGTGSVGVYLVFNETKILDVKKELILTSWSALIDSMNLDLASGKIKQDKWIVQELIFADEAKSLPACDLKFYCFYGKVALIKEVCRYPELRKCFWTTDLKAIKTGKYENYFFHGEGTNNDHIHLAASISSEIPVPFIRIDFLKSEKELVFGEFTPRPGKYESFNSRIDQWLGDMFLDAEGRLISDLLRGKKFETFNRFLSER